MFRIIEVDEVTSKRVVASPPIANLGKALDMSDNWTEIQVVMGEPIHYEVMTVRRKP